jgi:hypothetical protein
LGQCFIYGIKYVSNHQCNDKGLHMMKGVEDSEEFFKMAKGENNMIIGEE